jgi:hypothetical protein
MEPGAMTTECHPAGSFGMSMAVSSNPALQRPHPHRLHLLFRRGTFSHCGFPFGGFWAILRL